MQLCQAKLILVIAQKREDLRLEELHGHVDRQTLRHRVAVHQHDPEGHRLRDGQGHRRKPDAGKDDLKIRMKDTIVSLETFEWPIYNLFEKRGILDQ